MLAQTLQVCGTTTSNRSTTCRSRCPASLVPSDLARLQRRALAITVNGISAGCGTPADAGAAGGQGW
ncbi:hypothetical protein HBB16_15225 [Pseudonocardia sp. MCCB 268]|nr:hypothetical protein [Pseudonocardia cytotoxica]